MIFLCMIIWIVFAIPMMFIDSFFEGIGIEKDVADYAVSYLTIIYPFYGFEIVAQCYFNFAGFQRVVHY